MGKNVTPLRSFVGLRCFFQHLALLMHAVACMAAIDRYNPKRFPYPFSAEVAKSVDAVDSKSTVEIRAGSSPAFGTISTSKTIRESPPNPLKSMLAAISSSRVVRGSPLKSGCHWGHNWGHLNFD